MRSTGSEGTGGSRTRLGERLARIQRIRDDVSDLADEVAEQCVIFLAALWHALSRIVSPGVQRLRRVPAMRRSVRWLSTRRTPIRAVGLQHPTVVLDVRGDVITHFRQINRDWVRLEDVSPHFINALLVTEDRRFFDHAGIDVRRIRYPAMGSP